MMKIFSSLLAILQIFLFFNPLAHANERQIQCKVVGISDGDTLTCLYNRTPLKVRLQYIDAPESAQPFGQRAKQALATLAFKKEVMLIISGYDRYQRLLGVVFDERGNNLNLQLVQQGMAWAYRQTQPIYQQAQQKAQNQRLGLWRDTYPINPADWRRIKTEQENKRLGLGGNLQNLPQTLPLTAGINCNAKLSCNQIGRMGHSPAESYALAERYFRQCGWAELDGNNDSIPCNKLYRKAK